MRRLNTLGLGLLLLSAVGGVDGQDRKPATTQIEKEADAWFYPKAKVTSSASSGSVFQAVMTTADDIQTVLKHYDKRCETSLAGEDTPPAVFDSKSDVADGKRMTTLSADDSTIPLATKKKGTPRGVTLRQLTRDEPGYFVTVLVTRTKDDSQTHLLFTYLKK